MSDAFYKYFIIVLAIMLYAFITGLAWEFFPSIRWLIVIGWLLVGGYAAWVAWYLGRHGQT